MATIIDEGILVAHQPGTARQSCCFPRVTVLPSGRWLAAFRAAPGKQDDARQCAMLTWSDDKGKSWSSPIAPFKSVPQVDGRPGTLRAACLTPLGGRRVLAATNWQDCSDPSLPLFNPATEGVIDLRVFIALSEDEGLTWNKPQRVDDRPYDQIPVSITGPVLLMSDGRWACQFELNKTYQDAGPWNQAAVMTFSSDAGRTWGGAVDAARDSSRRMLFWDQRPQVMDDGSVLDLFWTFDRQSGEYVNIHAARSEDAGRTWSAPWDTGVPGQPAAPVPLGGDRVAMVYVDRDQVPTIKLRLSNDCGQSFKASEELVLARPQLATQTVSKRAGDSTDAWSEMSAFSIGLPDAIRINRDEVLAVFYTGPDKDHTDIRWVRVRV